MSLLIIPYSLFIEKSFPPFIPAIASNTCCGLPQPHVGSLVRSRNERQLLVILHVRRRLHLRNPVQLPRGGRQPDEQRVARARPLRALRPASTVAFYREFGITRHPPASGLTSYRSPLLQTRRHTAEYFFDEKCAIMIFLSIFAVPKRRFRGLHIRRDAGVVDRAALEMRCTGNCTGGSNPSLSATSASERKHRLRKGDVFL